MFRNSFGYYKTLSVHHFEAGCLKEKQQNTIYLPGQCFVSVRPTMAATSHLRLLSTWNGAIVIAELNFYLIYFKCKSYTCYSWHGFWLNEKREPHLFFPLEYGKSQLSMSKSLIFSVVRISPTAGASMASQSCSPTPGFPLRSRHCHHSTVPGSISALSFVGYVWSLIGGFTNRCVAVQISQW